MKLLWSDRNAWLFDPSKRAASSTPAADRRRLPAAKKSLHPASSSLSLSSRSHTRSTIPPNSQQARINSGNRAQDHQKHCMTSQANTVDQSCGHSPGHVLQLFKSFAVLPLQIAWLRSTLEMNITILKSMDVKRYLLDGPTSSSIKARCTNGHETIS